MDNDEATTPRHVPDHLSILVLLVFGYAATWFLLGGSAVEPNGGTVIPPGALWSVIVIWLGAQVGGATAAALKLPGLLGMLLSGMILRNLPGELVEDLPKAWSGAIRSAGLSVILMRSGLELDLEAFKKVGWMAVRLTVMPGASEAIVAGCFATIIFGMHLTLGLSLGFILGAVSPAVVVLGMFDLQSRGYGVFKGIPSLVVAAASFDDVVAISGYTIFRSFALSAGHGGLAWTIMHGPVDMVTGVVAGALCGVIASATAMWNSPMKRSAVIFLLGMLLMFAGKHVDFAGGGAMGGLCMGIVANKLWSSGWAPGGKVGRLSTGPDNHFAHEVESDLAVAWKSFFQPLLFGVIGSAIKFADLSPETIPRSILLVVIGLCIRLPAAFVACSFGELDFKEKLFIALAWMPKATVQAALASDPLETIQSTKRTEGNYLEWEQWGNDILTTAVFSIILTAPMGMMIINFLGPRWLSKDVDVDGKMDDLDVALKEATSALPDEPEVCDESEVEVLMAAHDHIVRRRPSLLPPNLRSMSPSSPNDVYTRQPLESLSEDASMASMEKPSKLNQDVGKSHLPRRGSLDSQRGSLDMKALDAIWSTAKTVESMGVASRTSADSSLEGSGRRTSIDFRSGRRQPRHSVGTLDIGRRNSNFDPTVGTALGVMAMHRRMSRLRSNSNSVSTMDASEKLEILTTSLKVHIQEEGDTERARKMLGTLDALKQLARKNITATARPAMLELFDTPGSFFRFQKEDFALGEAASDLLPGENDHPV